MLTVGSLFSGIGGLELGLEWAGLGPTLWQVEREGFCRCVLEHHWPEAKRFDDVRTVGATQLAQVDLICGGFPCQDVSSAGKGEGLAGERSGLWREFARVVGEIRPSWVVVENVASGAGRWLDAIVRELEELGYGCLPLPLSASAVGAPHRRERIFVVAHVDGLGSLEGNSEARASGAGRAVTAGAPAVAYAHDARREGSGSGEENEGRGRFAPVAGWSPEPGLVPLVHGLSGGLAGRRRRARIRALGNSVVPQCAEVVGWVIRELLQDRRADV